MSDLADFLLARIAEDEAVARAATPGPWATQTMAGNLVYGDPEAGVFVCDTGVGVEQVLDDAAHIARWNPARALAECDAKRRIVQEVVADIDSLTNAYASEIDAAPFSVDYPSHTLLCLLALPYADHHPDYQQDWRR